MSETITYKTPESRKITLINGLPFEFYMEEEKKEDCVLVKVGFRPLKILRKDSDTNE